MMSIEALRRVVMLSALATSLAACGGPASEEQTGEDALLDLERRPKQGPALTGILSSSLAYRPLRLGSARHADGTVYPSLFVSSGELRELSFPCCGRPIPPAVVAGSTFLTRDNAYRFRVSAAGAPAGTGLSGLVYQVETQRFSQTTSWAPLCLAWVDSRLVNEAVPMRGYFDSAQDTWIDDPTMLTFVCRGSAAFKAISWGYAPEPRPLHFRAAVRAARADYCGTGDPYTYPGTEIAIFDLDGIRADPGPADGMHFEAAWLVDEALEIPVSHGALCLSKRRWDTLRPTTPAPGTTACTSLPFSGEFQQVCRPGSYTDAPGSYPEPSAADLSAMHAAGALLFTRSRNLGP